MAICTKNAGQKLLKLVISPKTGAHVRGRAAEKGN
jgi:hypothetical protein